MYAAYPRPLRASFISDRLPNVWHGEDRSHEAIRALVWQARQRIGRHSVITCGHLGYRLADSARAMISEALAA
jgi:hypothetical protein